MAYGVSSCRISVLMVGALRGLNEDMIQDDLKQHDIEQMGHNA
jgi:hypothetical protein